ncbi:MAG: tetratricopeptide repeat protein [Rhodospirillales bacterium]|nr:tetratricopeptide repeat protein [Rhodospirillales bacterium]
MIKPLPFLRPVAILATSSLMMFSALAAAADTAKILPGQSPIGNYLAGRHAESERDLSLAADFLKAVLDQSPEVPDLRRRTFVLLVMEGRIAEALPMAVALDDKNPDGTVTNLVLAAHEIKEGQFAAAVERLKGQPNTGLSGLAAPLLLAWALAAQEKIDDGLGALAPVQNEKGSKSLADLHKAMLLDFSGRPDAAKAAFEKLTTEEETPSFRHVEIMGSLYERTGDTEAAKTLYDSYEKNNPGTNLLFVARQRLEAGTRPGPIITAAADGAAEVLFGIANSLRVQRARETALLLGQLALYIKPDYPIMQILAGEILEMDERYEDANRLYEKIGVESPFGQTAKMRIANNYHDMGRTDEAIAIVREIARTHPDDPVPASTIGDFLRASERYKEAIPEYDEAIRRAGDLQANHWRLLYTRGIVLEREKFFAKAEADFLKALELQPDQPFVLNYLVYSWIEQGMHLERAQEMIRKAVSLRPNDGYIIDSLGWVYYQLGKYDDAVAELERAVEYRPEDPVINDHLGDAYWQVGRREEARFQWLHSLSLKPEPEVEKSVREKLKNGLQPTSKSIKEETLPAAREEG